MWALSAATWIHRETFFPSGSFPFHTQTKGAPSKARACSWSQASIVSGWAFVGGWRFRFGFGVGVGGVGWGTGSGSEGGEEDPISSEGRDTSLDLESELDRSSLRSSLRSGLRSASTLGSAAGVDSERSSLRSSLRSGLQSTSSGTAFPHVSFFVLRSAAPLESATLAALLRSRIASSGQITLTRLGVRLSPSDTTSMQPLSTSNVNISLACRLLSPNRIMSHASAHGNGRRQPIASAWR
jgi:hypothetical protein